MKFADILALRRQISAAKTRREALRIAAQCDPPGKRDRTILGRISDTDAEIRGLTARLRGAGAAA